MTMPSNRVPIRTPISTPTTTIAVTPKQKTENSFIFNKKYILQLNPRIFSIHELAVPCRYHLPITLFHLIPKK